MWNPGRPKTKWGNQEVRDPVIDLPPPLLQFRQESLDCGICNLTIWEIEISSKIGDSGVRIFEYFEDVEPNFCDSMAMLLAMFLPGAHKLYGYVDS